MDKGRLFEQRVLEAVRKLGFEATTTRVTGDGGIDIVAVSGNTLVSGKYIIQCKNWTKPVGEPEVRDLYGVVHAENANKGILITTSTFTTPARQFAEGKQLELIDGTGLSRMLGGSAQGGEPAPPISRAARVEPLLAYLRENPRNIKALKELADLHVNYELGEQDWSTAISFYDQIIALGPPRLGSSDLLRIYVDTLANKAACHLATGDVPKAVRCLVDAQRQARKGSLEWMLVTADLGKTYHYLEMYEAATRTYRLLGEGTALLTDELDLALMESQPTTPFAIGLRHLNTVIGVSFFPDPVSDVASWMSRSDLFLSTMKTLLPYLSVEEPPLEPGPELSSLADVSMFADTCISVASSLRGPVPPAPAEGLEPYRSAVLDLYDKESAVLCMIADSLRAVTKLVLDETGDPDALSRNRDDLRMLVIAATFGGERGPQINALASEITSRQAEIASMFDEALRTAREYLRVQKSLWRAAVR